MANNIPANTANMLANTAGILSGLTGSSEGLRFVPGDKAPPFGPNVVITSKSGLQFAPAQPLSSEALELANQKLQAIAVREQVNLQLKQMGIYFEKAVDWNPPVAALDLAVLPAVSEKPVLDRSIEALDLAVPKVSKPNHASLFGATAPRNQVAPLVALTPEEKARAEELARAKNARGMS